MSKNVSRIIGSDVTPSLSEYKSLPEMFLKESKISPKNSCGVLLDRSNSYSSWFYSQNSVLDLKRFSRESKVVLKLLVDGYCLVSRSRSIAYSATKLLIILKNGFLSMIAVLRPFCSTIDKAV